MGWGAWLMEGGRGMTDGGGDMTGELEDGGVEVWFAEIGGEDGWMTNGEDGWM